MTFRLWRCYSISSPRWWNLLNLSQQKKFCRKNNATIPYFRFLDSDISEYQPPRLPISRISQFHYKRPNVPLLRILWERNVKITHKSVFIYKISFPTKFEAFPTKLLKKRGSGGEIDIGIPRICGICKEFRSLLTLNSFELVFFPQGFCKSYYAQQVKDKKLLKVTNKFTQPIQVSCNHISMPLPPQRRKYWEHSFCSNIILFCAYEVSSYSWWWYMSLGSFGNEI